MVVFEGVFDGFADVDESGEVEDDVDGVFGEDGVEEGAVVEVTFDEFDGVVDKGIPVAVDEVIEHENAVVLGDEVTNDVGTDVTGATDDESCALVTHEKRRKQE